MSALWVLPSIDPEWRKACVDTLGDVVDRLRLMVVDNSHVNRGVAGSWNLGARAAMALGVEHLIVLSESVRFDPGGAEEFEAAVGGYDTALVTSPCVGLHLVAFSVDALRVVGPFDEGFWPAYCEDTDWLYRATLLTVLTVAQVDARVRDAGVAHSLQTGRVRVNLQGMNDRYAEKWGGYPGSERWSHPWNDKAKRIDWPGW